MKRFIASAMLIVMCFSCLGLTGCSYFIRGFMEAAEQGQKHEPVIGTDPDTGLPLYYTIYDNGCEKQIRRQEGNTCWAYACASAMEYSWQYMNGESLTIDALDLAETAYDPDRDEGLFIPEGEDPRNYAGNIYVVRNEIASQGYNGLNLIESSTYDEAEIIDIKNALLEYGALAVGVNDYGTKYREVNGTTTYLGNIYCDVTHMCVVVGWDDSFPKEDFCEEATQDGAWLVQNSYDTGWGDEGCFWVSYDTPFKEISSFVLSDEYSQVLSYDRGSFYMYSGFECPTVANVFHEPGTLSAVGTYTEEDDSTIVIEIWDAEFSEVIYSQTVEVPFKGYHVFELDEPIDVTDYAIAVTYSGYVPIEGPENDVGLGNVVPTCSEGQSFVNINGEWCDMSDNMTKRRLRLSVVPNNCCIHALYA